MKIDLTPSNGFLALKNPVLVPFCTIGYGLEYSDIIDPDIPGAQIKKTITLHERERNPHARIVGTPKGILNSSGLQNVWIDRIIVEELPELLDQTSIPVNASIGGDRIEEHIEVEKRLDYKTIGGSN